ncbi:MAG TPA: RHS repeat-associated core domain-containing protein [Solirubrobacterales bacterium]|nr:RHS repeat-associated core domain-containing protein [Solirubrobacterales bacterium]
MDWRKGCNQRSVAASVSLLGVLLALLISVGPIGQAGATEWSLQPTANPTPLNKSELEDVSCPTASMCMGIGNDYYLGKGFAQVWKGSEWKMVRTFAGQVKAVSCPTATFCATVAKNENGAWRMQEFEFSPGEGTWFVATETPAIPSGATNTRLVDISCTSAAACTAVGRYQAATGEWKAHAERWNGSSWSPQALPAPAGETRLPELTGVSCASGTACTAVGTVESRPPGSTYRKVTLAARWNGSSWSLDSTPTPTGATSSSLEAVSCFSSSSCMAIGTYNDGSGAKPFSERLEGVTWSVAATATPADAKWPPRLRSVSCTTATSCLAVGHYVSAVKGEGIFQEPAEEKTLVERWDGSQWAVQSSPNPAEEDFSALAGVSCSSQTVCTAVGKSRPASAEEDMVTLGMRWYETDVESPDTSITGGPEGLVAIADASFSFEASEINTSFQCSMDQGAFGPCASPSSYQALADGVHIFRVRATDAFGNQDESPVERNFEVDTEAPQTEITSSQPSYTSGQQTSVEFSASEPASTYQCSFDGGELESCQSPYVLPENLHLGSGWHTFTVVATDTAGNVDATPAKWTFNTAIYPDAPTTSKVTTPEEGKKSSHYFTLKAQWGEAPTSGGVTGVTFQMKIPGWKQFWTIPSDYVLDSKGEPVSWPLPVSSNPGHSETVYFNYLEAVKEMKWGMYEEDIKLRAVFDGGVSAAGASQPVAVEFLNEFGGVGAPTDATESIGPVNLDLLTGNFTITRIDVSIPVPGTESSLEFARSYQSRPGYVTSSEALGRQWMPSGPMEQEFQGEAWVELQERHEDAVPPVFEEECWWEGGSLQCETFEVEAGIPAADWIELIDNEGNGVPFEIVGGQYVAPDYMKEFVLSKEGEAFVLTDPNGAQTTFIKNQYGTQGSYRPNSISWQATAKSARHVYEYVPGTTAYRLVKMIAPAPAGVTCGVEGSISTPGCRTLAFQYSSCECMGHWRLSSITYYNSSGQPAEAQVVSRYEYDSEDRLIAQWDPRISPALKETYTYPSSPSNDMLALTPPGEEPWEFEYYKATEFPWDPVAKYHWRDREIFNRLKSVKRATLLESPSTAQTTIVYQVPLSGEEAPYNMSPSTVAKWGQSDYPVDATAIFPPSHVPDSPRPSDYTGAGIHYLDPEGYEVNTASAAPPGVAGSAITTTESDDHGNVIRSLSAQNRLRALGSVDSVGRSRELDSHSVYSADGTEMLESWGPLHEVRLESGETVEARQHTTVKYDEGAPALKEGESAPRLPTKETTGAAVPGQSSDSDQRVTETRYDWTLRKPIETIVDPGGLNIRSVMAYDATTGQPREVRQPSNPGGGGAGSTRTIYYSQTANSEQPGCGGVPQYAGLPCKVMPAAQPGTAGLPQLLVKTFWTYNNLDQPTEIRESPGGGSENLRRTLLGYDMAGRPRTQKIEGGGQAVPMVETLYSSTNGRPVEQKFLCSVNCTGFDSQATRTTYDALGRVKRYEDADGGKANTLYDAAGRPYWMNVEKNGQWIGAQLVRYDEASGVPVELESEAGIFTARYDADGKMIEQGLPNGLTATTSYNEVGESTHLTYTKESYCGESCTWLDFDLERSIEGQILSENGTLGAQRYGYDKAGRLIFAEESPDDGQCTTRSYVYDLNSNRKSLTTRSPGIEGACANTGGTTKTYEYDAADRLVAAELIYDSFGRITKLPGHLAGDEELTTSYFSTDMVASQSQGGITNTFELDASLRQRARHQAGGLEGTEIFHYAGPSDSPAWTERGQVRTLNMMGLGGELVALKETSAGGQDETTLQLANLHGDIVATAPIDQEVTSLVKTTRYDEFGNPIPGNADRYGWLGGKQRRTELPSGVIQMGVRSYVPTIGRFLSPDPVRGGSATAYDYSNADPINVFDLSGEAPPCKPREQKLKPHRGAGREIRVSASAWIRCKGKPKNVKVKAVITGGAYETLSGKMRYIPAAKGPLEECGDVAPKFACHAEASTSFTSNVPCGVVRTGEVEVLFQVSWETPKGNRRSHTYRDSFSFTYGSICTK